MPPKGRPKKKVEDKLQVNEAVKSNEIKKIGKIEKASKRGIGKEVQGIDIENTLNGFGDKIETEVEQAEVASASDVPASDKIAVKGRKKPAKGKVELAAAEGKEESSKVKEEALPAKRGRRAAKIENVDANKELNAEIETEVEANNVKEEGKEDSSKVKEEALPAKRGRRAAKIQNDVDTDKELNVEKKTEVEADDAPRSRRKAKAEIESQDSKKEQNIPEYKGRKAMVRAKDLIKNEIPDKVIKDTKGVGRKRRNAVEYTESAEVEDKKPKIEENRQLRVALKRSQNLDEMARQQKENDAEDFEEPKVKTVKGPAKGKGKRAAKDAGEDSQPAKKTKDGDAKSKGNAKKEKEKIPDVSALDFSNESKTKDGKPWNLKIATWNVNGLRAWLEKNGMSYLHHEKPDILCIQETKCSLDKLPPEVNVDGYHCYWLAGDKEGYSGVGLLSKEKPLSVQYGIGIADHDKEGRVITTEYDGFYLVTAYIPNAGRNLIRLNYRQEWDEEFRAYLKKLDEKKPVVLCGDLNVAHEEIDLANPKTNKKNAGFTPEEREGFSTLLSEGFIDSFRHFYPNKTGAYTFWTYMMNARAKNVGWRLDYFVVSKRFADHLCDSVIRKDVFGSDHCPTALFLHV